MLTTDLIERVLATIPHKTVGLLGDLFLDRYLDIDPALDEPSVETGLTAYQVTRVRCWCRRRHTDHASTRPAGATKAQTSRRINFRTSGALTRTSRSPLFSAAASAPASGSPPPPPGRTG